MLQGVFLGLVTYCTVNAYDTAFVTGESIMGMDNKPPPISTMSGGTVTREQMRVKGLAYVQTCRPTP